MRKMILCVIGGLTGLIICFSCTAQQPAGKNTDLGTVKTEYGVPAQILIINKSEDDIIALYEKTSEQLYVNLVILSAIIQQKTVYTKPPLPKKHDMCMQIKSKAMRELYRVKKLNSEAQTEQKTLDDKKIRDLLLRKVFRANAIAKGAQEP